MIEPDDFMFMDNLEQCVCGSYAHVDQMEQDPDGNFTCPECMQEHLRSVIDIYFSTLKAVSDGDMEPDSALDEIKRRFCELIAISQDDFDESGMTLPGDKVRLLTMKK